MRNLRESFAASGLVLQALFLNALAVPATAYIIRTLGPLGYGQWAVATTLTTVFLCITNLGLRTLFVRRLAQHPEGAGEALAEQLGVRLTLGLLAAALAVLGSFLLRYPLVVVQCTLLSAGGLVFSAALYTLADLFQGLRQFSRLTWVNLAAGLSLTAASIVAVRLGGGPVGLAGAYLLGPCAGVCLGLALVRRQFKLRVVWSAAGVRRLLGEARLLGLQQLFNAGQSQAEALLVPKLLGFAVFGYFTAGTLLASRLAIVPDGFGTAFYPLLARAHMQGQGNIRRAVLRYLALAVGSCLLLVAGTFLVARPIAELLFPRHAAVCLLVMRITILSLPFLALSQVMEYSLNAVGREKEQARCSLWAGAGSLVVTVALVSAFGLVGACASWVLRHLVFCALRAPAFLSLFSGEPGSAERVEPRPHPELALPEEAPA